MTDLKDDVAPRAARPTVGKVPVDVTNALYMAQTDPVFPDLAEMQQPQEL